MIDAPFQEGELASRSQHLRKNISTVSEVLARYHLERRDFFEFIGKGANFLNILLGMGVTLTLISGLRVGNIEAPYIAAFMVGLISALSLLINPAYLQAKHEQSAKGFLSLKKKMDFFNSKDSDDELVREFHDLRAENPPTYLVLFIVCRNLKNFESSDNPFIVRVPWYRNLFRNVFKQSDWIHDVQDGDNLLNSADK